ncbi:MAG TPA: hypothetical protein PKE27_15890 [Povalibacter sp.]|uniref:hypothetical protein n=1 Tax=Povalibacter sp. TaxID=1962978 RepID=UPI002BA1C872|nr:hypothetical protein [Povalibacter sp.]HMN46060.1 hypothetical protein [Povalibacter sp.]
MLEEIIAELERSEEAKGTEISQNKIREWMRTANLDALGALYALLSKSVQAARVAPPECGRQDRLAVHGRPRCGLKQVESMWAELAPEGIE